MRNDADLIRELLRPKSRQPPASAPATAAAGTADARTTAAQRRGGLGWSLAAALLVVLALAGLQFWRAGGAAPLAAAAPARVDSAPATLSPMPGEAPPATLSPVPGVAGPAPREVGAPPVPESLSALLLPPPGASAAVPTATLAQLLQARPSPDWRWQRYAVNTSVLVIEFPSLAEQGRAMNRIAAMVEKRGGRRDRLLADRELAQLISRNGDSTASFLQGHDYPADRLARFFTLAASQAVRLNPHELRLRALLAEAGVLQRSAAGGWRAAGWQAVVSFTAVQADDPQTLADETVDAVRREAVLRHELSHGEFFTDAAYRARVLHFWRRTLADAERRLFSNYLAGIGYDARDDELMANETQALLMHTPDSRAFDAAALGIGQAALDDMRRRFQDAEPARPQAAAPRR